MDMDNDVGTDCGSRRRAWWKGAKGENWDNYDSINNKIFKLKINLKYGHFYV